MTTHSVATVYCWDDLTQDHPMALLSRRRIIGQKMMISEIALDQGCNVPSHSHANEQFTIVLSGCLRFGLGELGGSDHRVVEVRAGEVLHLPPHVCHSAYAVENTLVLDIFSPPSQTTGIDRE